MDLLGASGGSLTLASGEPERLTVFCTDPTAARLEELQDTLGEGPVFEAYRTMAAVVVQLDRPSSAVPVFEVLARRQTGVRAVHALPMRSGGECVGVLTLYSRTSDRLERPVADAQAVADAVGAALLEDTRLDGTDAAWADRARVHQATGMVVAGLGIAVEDALALLRAHAFTEGVTLRQVATAVVDRALVFERSGRRRGPGPAGDGTDGR